MKEFKVEESGAAPEDDFFLSGRGLYGGSTTERRKAGFEPKLGHPLVLDPFGDDENKRDWKEFTSGNGRLEMEIGFGPGAFLRARSLNCPETRFLGFEVRTKQCKEVLETLTEREQSNARVIQTDARPVLQHFLEDESLDELHINFPDPWWKKKHHKRRVFTPGFLSVARAKLKVGGSVWLRTDVEAYFKHVQSLFSAANHFETGIFEANVLEWTHRERRCTLYGMPIYRLQMKRVD